MNVLTIPSDQTRVYLKNNLVNKYNINDHKVKVLLTSMFFITFIILGQNNNHNRKHKTINKVLLKSDSVFKKLPESHIGVQQALMDSAIMYYKQVDSIQTELEINYRALLYQQNLLTIQNETQSTNRCCHP